MTWQAIELSVEDGAPIELHEFVYDSVYYRYTSSDEDYLDGNGNTWQAEAIVRSQFSDSQTEGRSDVSLECALDLDALVPFRSGVPLMSYNLYQVHATDGDVQVRQLYSGRVTDVVFHPGEWKAAIVCKSFLATLEEPGLRRKCSKQCPHVLYGPGCNLSPLLFEVPVTVATVAANTVQLTGAGLAGKGDDYFPGGYLQWTNSLLGVDQKLMVASYNSVTGTATLVNVPQGLAAGASARIYPGCDHTITTCDSKFSNIVNFGGTPFIPDKSPFGGTTLY